jgi:hypothetical protein
MLTDYQTPKQITRPSDGVAMYPLLRDIMAIVALILCLLVGVILEFYLSGALISFSLRGMSVVPVLAGSALYTASGLFHFLCGFWLAKSLRQINPWYVVIGLAVASVLLTTLAMLGLKPHIAASATTAGPLILASPFLLALDVLNESCLLLFLSLGIWCQRRTLYKR